MISLDDEKLGVLAEVLSNKTAKKIIEFLADKEASESEISQKLNLPANTVNYNVRKLLEAGLIEKSKNYFWSRKGKKMVFYRVAKKSIIISPKSSNTVKVVSTILITGIAAVLVKIFSGSFIQKSTVVVRDSVNYINQTFNESLTLAKDVPMAAGSELSLGYAKSTAQDIVVSNNVVSSTFSQPWFWFVMGALVLGIVYLALSKLKRR